MRRRRVLWMVLGSLAGLVLIALVVGVLTLRSPWFYEKVRQGIVTTVEDASGGRVEVQSFYFDWRRMRAEVRSFTLHGIEAAGKPPLFSAPLVAVGLKIVSIFKRKVDIQYLEVTDPRVYLIVYPDGRTNVPEPRVKRSNRNAAETILDLAIGRFNLQNGIFEVESRSRTPFDARGQNLNARFDYEMLGPRYRGELSIQPLDLKLANRPQIAAGVNMAVVVEKNRIEVSSAKLTTGDSVVDLKGAVEDLTNPRVAFRYDARLSVVDATRLLRINELRGGTVRIGGEATWSERPGLLVNGRLSAERIEYRDAGINLRDWRAEGGLAYTAKGFDLSGLELAGNYLLNSRNLPVTAQIASATLRGENLNFHTITLQALGGSFRGDARLQNLDRLTVTGELKDFAARRTIALYSQQALPWDAKVSGSMRLELSLRRKQELRATANLALAPAPGSGPVHGQIAATYEARGRTLDLGRSTVTLPHSRADFSGIFGNTLRVHAESTDLNDILPVLGAGAATVPLKLEGGAIVFDGTVTGKLDHPDIAGHVHLTRFSYGGTPIDSIDADVTASPENLRLQNATAVKGALTAKFQAAVALQEWKTSDASMIFGDGSIRNAPLGDLAALAGRKDFPATGTVTANGQFSGTIGNPLLKGDLEVTKGTLYDEPFDSLTARLDYGGARVEAADVQITAGPKQVRLAASYQYRPGSFDTGRLHFQVNSNAMSLDQIQTLQKSRPGVKGTVQVTASGDLDLAPETDGSQSVRVASLQADLTGQGLQFSGQPLGNAHLVATSQGQTLKTHLDANFADSQIRGDGEWKLEDDYPGEATVSFSRLDLAQLRSWIAPAKSTGPDRFTGSAEGEFRISGPLLKTEALRAQLRLPKFAVGSTPGAGLPANYSFENAGPIVATLANSVVTIGSARFTGRDTELTVGGRVVLQPKTALDLRVDGKIGLGILRDFERDIEAAGVVTADATVRGDFEAPQITGRLLLDNASFSLANVPNGISKASGVVLFNKDRATIQNLSGETGGGRIFISGFYAYGGPSQVFSIAARAQQVRVRYPEGVSTVANANLTWTGNVESSRVGGTVTIVRAGFNPQSDFSSILSRSAGPIRTPSTEPGLLSGMMFDVQINTDPDIQFQSELTQDIQVDANLRLRGTAANPAVLGRINITQGQVVFQGMKFGINQGSVSFYNPSKLDPILDIDLETKARGIDITLTISGPLDKLNMIPRSDPPLEYQEIVELLATGKAPTSDPSRLAQQDTSPQSWQQMGASKLLGQVIANPVAGRLQRFFGVSKLKIDPTLPGVENNLQARLTLEQQVTPNITFTYITNVTSSNPQVVRVEWALNKQWSVVALREENGVFGLDFFFKKRF